MGITIRSVHDPQELEQVIPLEIAVWGAAAEDMIPVSLMRSFTMNGGLVLIAENGTQAVGVSIAYPTRRNTSSTLLWSQIAGVHPDHQGQGIGRQLKQTQRAWAREHGYDAVGWTFDPMQQGNANFNLNHLGAFAVRYHVNFYGPMTDEINKGTRSDRLEAFWPVYDADLSPDDRSGHALLSEDTEMAPRLHELGAHRTITIALPSLPNLRTENLALFSTWQDAVCSAFSTAFEAGYRASAFDATGPCYVLTRGA